MSIPNLQAFGFAQDYQSVYDLAYRYSKEELYPLCGKLDDGDGDGDDGDDDDGDDSANDIEDDYDDDDDYS